MRGKLQRDHAQRLGTAVFWALLVATLASCSGHPLLAQISPAVSAFAVNAGSADFASLDNSATPLATTPQQTPDAGVPNAPQPVGSGPAAQESGESRKTDCQTQPCPASRMAPIVNWYRRFQDGPQVKPMTPAEKGWLATRNFLDPFNAITILGEGAISVAADSHSAYGPGIPGWGRYVGVSFTQDLTGEFFNTFLIPSIVHQDPHYHRMPHARYVRRVFNAVDQVVWTRGDNGKGMLNYANLVGYAIDDEISNLYVPGRQTNASATAQRYGIALATSPISNLIDEFLPDVARRIHVQSVLVQRIINHVAVNSGSD